MAIEDGAESLIIVVGDGFGFPMGHVLIVGFSHALDDWLIGGIVSFVVQFERILAQVVELFCDFEAFAGVAPVDILHVFGDDTQTVNSRVFIEINQ